jgi:hypothetical protein
MISSTRVNEFGLLKSYQVKRRHFSPVGTCTGLGLLSLLAEFMPPVFRLTMATAGRDASWLGVRSLAAASSVAECTRCSCELRAAALCMWNLVVPYLRLLRPGRAR